MVNSLSKKLFYKNCYFEKGFSFMLKEILLKVQKKEQESAHSIEKEVDACEKNIEKAKGKAKKYIEIKKHQNKILYEREIEAFVNKLQKQQKEFEEILNTECAKLEENFNKNSKVAIKAVINSFIEENEN